MNTTSHHANVTPMTRSYHANITLILLPISHYHRYEVHLVESWESPDSWNRTKGNTTRTIHAYSNAPFVVITTYLLFL